MAACGGRSVVSEVALAAEVLVPVDLAGTIATLQQFLRCLTRPGTGGPSPQPQAPHRPGDFLGGF